MARKLPDFLTAYLEYTKDTEPPTQYHLWCGISAISSALQRRTYMRWGTETIFPNMYIVLIGASGKCRKGVAFAIIQDVVRAVGIKSTAESITREALIKDIKESLNTFEDPDRNTVVFHCSLTAFSEELSIFLGQNDVKFLADLTDWYNCKPDWTYRTKGQGTDKIQGICFNLLGATAPDWLISILPQEAIGGGFTARVIFVVEEEKKEAIALPPAPNDELRSKLIADLEQISIMSGEMKFTKDAEEAYVDWYENKSLHTGVKDEKFGSYNERRATHIKKLCMAMSASRGGDRKITLSDFNRAILILTSAEKKMPRVFRGLGQSKYGAITMTVFDFISQRGETTASEILRKFNRDVDSYTLDIITNTLTGMRVVTTSTNIITQERTYKVTKLGKEENA